MTKPTPVKDAMWFTKKPVTIQAIQWTGENLREVITFTDGSPDTRFHHAGMAWDAYRDLVARDGLKVYTLEGTMLASPGDWIIRGVKGEHYPCKDEIFRLTYAAASSTPQALSAAPNGWESVIDEARSGLQDSEPSAFDNSGYRAFAETVLDAVAEGLSALAASPTPTAEQAAPKAAPGEPDPADIIAGALQISRGHATEMMREALEAASQQEAQEPYAYAVYFPDQPKVELVHDLDELIDDLTNRPHAVTPLYEAPQPAPAPLIARSLAEWHEQDGNVAWWAWNGREWAGEPAWIGTPNCEDWPGYHTHWTPHPEQPVCTALAAQGGKDA